MNYDHKVPLTSFDPYMIFTSWIVPEVSLFAKGLQTGHADDVTTELVRDFTASIPSIFTEETYFYILHAVFQYTDRVEVRDRILWKYIKSYLIQQNTFHDIPRLFYFSKWEVNIHNVNNGYIKYNILCSYNRSGTTDSQTCFQGNTDSQTCFQGNTDSQTCF